MNSDFINKGERKSNITGRIFIKHSISICGEINFYKILKNNFFKNLFYKAIFKPLSMRFIVILRF